jgi:hypothetical protein
MTATAPVLYHALDRCLLCRSANLETVVPLEPIPIATPVLRVPDAMRDDPRVYDGVPLALNLCRDCGQLQVSHKPDVEFEYRNYVYTTSLSAGLERHFAAYADGVVARYAPPHDGFVVEVGSNDGTLLRAFRNRGMRVLGIDPAVRIAERATAAGLETLPEFFSAALAKRIRSERGPANVVLANFVTANLEDMVDFAQGVRALLADDGIAVFETQYGADVIEGNLLDTVYHEHLSYYMVEPLRAHYARHGMELIAIERVPTKGGSIRLAVQPSDAGRPVAPDVAAMIGAERAKGMRAAGFYAELPRRIARIREQLATLVADVHAAGKTVAGWGVSVGTSALLPQFGLTRVVTALYDDDPNKDPILRGPDYAIPVRPTSSLYDGDAPGAIVVFAWRYIAGIMAKHRRYLAEGGAFVVPLPELSIIRGADAQPPNEIGV